MLGTEHLKLAEVAFAKQDYAEAIAQAKLALAAGLDLSVPGSERGEYWAHPETSQCELVLGMALHDSGAADAAIPHLNDAVALDRDRARPYANRGHVRRERGELDLALTDLDHALKRDPGYAFARFRRAQCYLDLGKASEAEQDLAVLLAPNPYDEAPLALWKQLREQRGLASDPHDLPAPRDYASLFGRAWAHAQHEQLERAIADYDAAFAIHEQPAVRAYRGMVYQRLGKLEQALADLEAYAVTDPSNLAVNASLLDVRTRIAARDA